MTQQTKTMWRIIQWEMDIKPVQVISETECFITFLEESWTKGKFNKRRCRKEGEFFNTFSAAKDYMILQTERRISNAEANWQREKSKLNKIKNLRETQLEVK